MRFEGTLTRSGRWWIAEIPILDAMTQGRTRREALDMIADWTVTMVNRTGFEARVYPGDRNSFEMGGNDTSALVALLLRRRRESTGASLREFAQRLNSSSPNAYARYERGEVVPSIDKLEALLKAASPGGDFVIREAASRR